MPNTYFALPSWTGITATGGAATSTTIKVTWSAVSHATAYSFYESTTSSNRTSTLVASSISTTSWTSGTWTANTNYWFEVRANTGPNWVSAKSSATGDSTIHSSSPFCLQP